MNSLNLLLHFIHNLITSFSPLELIFRSRQKIKVYKIIKAISKNMLLIFSSCLDYLFIYFYWFLLYQFLKMARICNSWAINHYINSADKRDLIKNSDLYGIWDIKSLNIIIWIALDLWTSSSDKFFNPFRSILFHILVFIKSGNFNIWFLEIEYLAKLNFIFKNYYHYF